MRAVVAQPDLSASDLELIAITSFDAHDDFVSVSAGSDIAVLTLSVDAGAVPLRIADSGHVADARLPVIVLGWGRTSEGGESSTRLLWASTRTVVRNKCMTPYPELPAGTICAGAVDGSVDTCQGDSGGPLVFEVDDEPILYGATSFGKGCGRPGFFGVYTDVGHYRDWLNQRIN
jgi:secreted trypsin-like serine protease